MPNYNSRQARASKQLKDYEQGTIAYLKRGTATGDAWNPSIAASTSFPVFGVVKGVSQKYIDGSHIVATDLQATIEVFDETPTVDGKLSVDSQEYEIKKVIQLPAAGTPIAWRLIIGA